MSFSDFMIAVPPWLRLLLAMGVTVAVTVLLVRAFHRQILSINATPAKDDDDAEAGPPASRDLGGRLIGLATFAFVFLPAFGFGQFWTTAKDARNATLSEATDYARAMTLAEHLPTEQSKAIVAALQGYRDSIVDTEWPLMQRADSAQLATVRFQSGSALTSAILDARQSADANDPVWTNLTSSVDDLLSDALNRTNAIPSPLAVSIVALVFVLGLTNLFVTALFQPAALKPNLYIIAAFAALTAFLLFVLVEISNPYTGAGAITSQLVQTR